VRRLPLLLMVMGLLAGCDKLTGAADQKIADAEAIGFACRVSGESPEDCMKENDARSPSSILDGWKSADEDIKAGKLDPHMGTPAGKDGGADKPADGAGKPADAADAKPADAKAADVKKDEKPAKQDHPKEESKVKH
jgi:hypothetical protein